MLIKGLVDEEMYKRIYDKTQQDGLKYNKVSKIVYFAAISLLFDHS